MFVVLKRYASGGGMMRKRLHRFARVFIGTKGSKYVAFLKIMVKIEFHQTRSGPVETIFEVIGNICNITVRNKCDL